MRYSSQRTSPDIACKRATRILVVPLLAVIGFASTAHAQYSVGFTWNRSADWVAGTTIGRGWGAGNPCKDQAGFPTWSAEAVSGGPLGAPNEWFRQPPIGLLVWDDSWFGGPAAWARGNDFAPEVFRGALTDDQASGANPLVRWANPTRKQIQVDLSGRLELTWGITVPGTPADATADVVVAKQAMDGTVTVLLQRSVARPPTNQSDLPISITGLAVGPADAIVWTVRTQFNAAPTYVDLVDKHLQITLTGPSPCPADFNASGAISVQDIFDFLAAYFAGCV